MRSDVELAFRAARAVAPRYGLVPGELVGAAWRGVVQSPSPALALRSACLWAQDDARRILGLRRRWRPEPLFADPLGRTESDPRQRLMELWADTRPLRSGWCPRTRVWVYLCVVEGWTARQVAAAWGVGRPVVSRALSRVCPPGTFYARCGADPRGGVFDELEVRA